jgi:RNA-directed DNA polymerase
VDIPYCSAVYPAKNIPLSINPALSIAYLKSQGLYALRDGWIKLHHSQ